MSGETRIANHEWPRATVIAVAAGFALVGGTLALWAHYGSAVFFEVIAAGIAACF